MCVALILVPYPLFFYQSHKALLAYIHESLGSVRGGDGFTMFERLLYYSPFDGKGPPWADFHFALWGGLHFLFLIFLAAGRTLEARLAACAGVNLSGDADMERG